MGGTRLLVMVSVATVISDADREGRIAVIRMAIGIRCNIDRLRRHNDWQVLLDWIIRWHGRHGLTNGCYLNLDDGPGVGGHFDSVLTARIFIDNVINSFALGNHLH